MYSKMKPKKIELRNSSLRSPLPPLSYLVNHTSGAGPEVVSYVTTFFISPCMHKHVSCIDETGSDDC